MIKLSKPGYRNQGGAIFYDDLSELGKQTLLSHLGHSCPHRAHVYGIPLAYIQDMGIMSNSELVDREALYQYGVEIRPG